MTGRRMYGRIVKLGLLLCLSAGFPLGVIAQKEAPKPKPEVKDKIKPPTYPTPPSFPREPNGTNEKAIAADPNVAIKLCIAQGEIKINGTETNEVRVFVRDGRKFEFKSLEKNEETGKANWIWITAAGSPGRAVGPSANCLSGESVEIDMPMGGSIMLDAQGAGTEIDSIRKATLNILRGSINVRNVVGGVGAVVHRGDVTVESSSGAIDVQATAGNVMVFDVKPGQVGDLLKVRSSGRGNVVLQNVSHRQIDVSSISGNVSFAGKFLSGGIYKFKTSAGSIRMLLPEDTSCKVIASYGFGTFDSRLPLKIETENESEGGKSLVGRIGKGDTTNVSITTTSGSIGISQQGQKFELKF